MSRGPNPPGPTVMRRYTCTYTYTYTYGHPAVLSLSLSTLRCQRAGPLPSITQRRGILERYPRGTIIEEGTRPTKRKFPTVELPDIVLHLDAENCRHVRPFNRWHASQQKARWAKDSVADEVFSRASGLRREMLRDDKLMLNQASRPDTLQSISDYDVLAVALLGGSAVSPSLEDFKMRQEQSQRLRPVTINSLRENGIPERVLAGDANKVIPFMIHRQKLASIKEEEGDGGGGGGGVEAFTLTIRNFRTLSQLRKLCAARTKVSEQIWKSQAFVDDIVHTLRSMAPQPPRDVLKFINNFTIRQLSVNADLNASMSLYGLETASKLNLLAPIVQYLQFCLSQGCIGKDETSKKTLETVGRGMLIALERGQGTARGTRPELFTLLTGRSLDTSELQSALFGLGRLQMQEDPRIHLIYARLLAELGAIRLLWHAWRGDLETVDVTMFIRCVEVLSSAEGDASVDYTTATGDLEKDAGLDLRTINSLDAYHTSARRARAPYPTNFGGSFSPGEVQEACESADIHQAMARFGELISRSAAVRQSDEDTQSDEGTQPDADTQPDAGSRLDWKESYKEQHR